MPLVNSLSEAGGYFASPLEICRLLGHRWKLSLTVWGICQLNLTVKFKGHRFRFLFAMAIGNGRRIQLAYGEGLMYENSDRYLALALASRKALRSLNDYVKLGTVDEKLQNIFEE